jgi:hypothetical protein
MLKRNGVRVRGHTKINEQTSTEDIRTSIGSTALALLKTGCEDLFGAHPDQDLFISGLAD